MHLRDLLLKLPTVFTNISLYTLYHEGWHFLDEVPHFLIPDFCYIVDKVPSPLHHHHLQFAHLSNLCPLLNLQNKTVNLCTKRTIFNCQYLLYKTQLSWSRHSPLTCCCVKVWWLIILIIFSCLFCLLGCLPDLPLLGDCSRPLMGDTPLLGDFRPDCPSL